MSRPVTSPPGLISPLLAAAPVERRLAHQATTVRRLHRQAIESEAQLMCLGRELESSLFAAPGVEALMAKPFSETLVQYLHQPPESPPGSPAGTAFTTKARDTLREPLPASTAREALTPEPLANPPTERPHQSYEPSATSSGIIHSNRADPGPTAPSPVAPRSARKLPPDMHGRSKASSPVEQPPRNRHSSTREVTPARIRKPGSSPLPSSKEQPGKAPDKDRWQPVTQFPAELDAKAAGKRLAMRARRSGVSDAWDMPLKPPRATNPDRAVQANQRTESQQATGIPGNLSVVERQLAACLRGMPPRKRVTPEQSARKQPERGFRLPAGRPEDPVAQQDSRQTASPLPLSPHALNHDAAVKSTDKHGLRGLAARATGPIEPGESDASIPAAAIPVARSTQPLSGDDPAASVNDAHGVSAADLTRLLSDEARRAGIDVDEVGP